MQKPRVEQVRAEYAKNQGVSFPFCCKRDRESDEFSRIGGLRACWRMDWCQGQFRPYDHEHTK